MSDVSAWLIRAWRARGTPILEMPPLCCNEGCMFGANDESGSSSAACAGNLCSRIQGSSGISHHQASFKHGGWRARPSSSLLALYLNGKLMCLSCLHARINQPSVMLYWIINPDVASMEDSAGLEQLPAACCACRVQSFWHL